MCIGNRAESSSHYINNQLKALYENAVRCAAKHGTGLKPSESAIEYATCLYEFYGPGKHSRVQKSRRDLAFFATFGCPRVEFVCNHEVILILDLQEGHFNIEVNKSLSRQELHETINHYTVAFRIPFDTYPIDKRNFAAIGNASDYTMILHMLNMESAIFVPEHSSLPGITSISDERSYSMKERKLTALMHYLTKFYLQALKRAGHHVLCALPDFNNLASTTAHIDYSVISKRTLSTETLFGIRVEDVNAFLCSIWLQAASFVDEHKIDEHDPSPEIVSKTFLAELRTPPMDSHDDIYFHLHFGPLHVQPLCEREVVLYLDIQDILVYPEGFHEDFSLSLMDWKIAFIVDIIFEEADEGCTKSLNLTLSTARFCEHLSLFGEHDTVDIDLHSRIKRTLIRQISTYYLSLLRNTGTTTIYHRDERVHMDLLVDDDSLSEGNEPDDDDDDEGLYECSCEDEASCGHTGIRWGVLHRRLITHSHMNDFDFVTSLTQGSINAHFKALWDLGQRRLTARSRDTLYEIETEVCIADFSYTNPDHGDEVFFSSSFAPPKVQLVCREGSYSVILYVHLVDGYLKTLGTGKSLQPGSKDHTFSHWRLAFEVDLRLVESIDEAVPDAISDRPSTVKQLVLDLSTARLNLNLSTISSLLDDMDYRSIRMQNEALIYYIHNCYFPTFQRAHHDVLCTIPVFNKDNSGSDWHKLTSADFQIVPFNRGDGSQYVEGLYGRHRAVFDRNAIVIVGMTDGRELHSHALPRNVNWVGGVGSEVPLGTVCFSRRVFLENTVLTILERVNRETAIVPTFSGVENGEWNLKLTTWDKDEMKMLRKCNWNEVTKGNEGLEFVWMNKDEWNYKHFGNSESELNDHYAVSCSTRNVLCIPTSRRDTTTISIKGSMSLGLSYIGQGKDWNALIPVTWSAKIVLTSSPSGLQVQLSPSEIVPRFTLPQHITASGHAHRHGNETLSKVAKHLQEQFPASIDFAPLVSALKSGLEGAWAGAHVRAHELCLRRPVFTRRGDLLLELAVRTPNAGGMALNAGLGNAARDAQSARRSPLGLNGTITPTAMGAENHEHANGHAIGKGMMQTSKYTSRSHTPSLEPPTTGAVAATPQSPATNAGLVGNEEVDDAHPEKDGVEDGLRSEKDDVRSEMDSVQSETDDVHSEIDGSEDNRE